MKHWTSELVRRDRLLRELEARGRRIKARIDFLPDADVKQALEQLATLETERHEVLYGEWQ